MLATTIAFTQTFSISGIVVDATDNSALPGAAVQVFSLPDSTQQGTVTDADGTFTLPNLKAGNYAVNISYLGYATQSKTLEVRADIDLGRIVLSEDAVQLAQVQVVEQALTGQQIGDTTQFNANAFKTNPDANAEDLIRKMPGVTMQNGKLQAQGEDVKEVLVDGKPFFGNDPTAALRNLPADIISKIQVFDRQSEQSQFTGFNDGETSKTINIITKANSSSGQFGKIYGGYGTDNTYRAGGNLNIFNGDQRISIIGQTNNINQQNFASEDLVGAFGGRGGGGGRGGRGGGGGGFGRGGGGSSGDFLVDQQGGITQTHALGLNFSDQWGEKLEISGSYFLNKSDNNSLTLRTQEYLAGQFYNETSQVSSDNLNHRFNFRFDYTINDKNSLTIRPQLSFQQNNGLENTFGQTLLGGNLLNQTDYHFQSELTGMNFSNDILYRHSFAKKGRTISLNLNTRYNKNDGNSFLNSENLFFESDIPSDSLNQFSDLLNDGWNLSSNITYTEPVGEKGMLQLSYRTSWQQTDSDKRTFDFEEATSAYTALNEPLSNTFISDYVTHDVGTGYMLRSDKGMLNLRLSAEWAQLNNDAQFPYEFTLDRTFFNILPSASYRYDISKGTNLRFNYRTNTSAPSISQLQDVLNNSNPLQLRIGNPDLKQNYSHNLFTRFSKTNTEKSTVFFALLSGGYTENYIANSTFLAPQDTVYQGVLLPRGARLTKPVNLDGYWNARSFVTYGIPFRLIKSNLNFDINASFSRSPGLINDQLNYVNNTNLGGGLTISSNISENIDFTIGSRSSFNMARNSLNTAVNNDYFNQTSTLGLNWIFGGGFVFRTDLSHQYYSGLSAELDPNYILWNASIGRKLFKDKRGEIQLTVFDLLKQNTSVQRNVTEVYIEDVQTQVLQQYFMLTFTYQLRNFGQAPQEEERGRWGDGPPPGRF